MQVIYGYNDKYLKIYYKNYQFIFDYSKYGSIFSYSKPENIIIFLMMIFFYVVI